MVKGVIDITQKDFNEFTRKGNVVIEFGAPWCGPCRIMDPELEEAAEELKGKVKFGKINVDEQGDLAQRFQVMSVPTLIFFKNGEQVERSTGAIPKDIIIKKGKEVF
ncbi:MAG: thioredoxin [Nanoarchaeota archaeon]|nr:thioredoxin [Nanoarchaeota archaeon]